MQSKINEEIIPLRTKVFSRWFSRELNGLPNSNVQDVTKDLSNGVALVELAEVLTHKRAPRLWDHKPTMKAENVQNCNLAIEMFERDGVTFFGISGKDVSDNDQKQILSLIWSLILHYSVGNSMKNNFDLKPEKEILSWAHRRVEKYPSVNESFEPFELFMCALIDSFYPDKIMFDNLDVNNHQMNAKLAFDAMKDLNIPCFVYPEDLSKSDFKVDEMTLITQLSAVKSALNSNDIQKKGIEIAFSSPEELKIKNQEANVRAELQREMELKNNEKQKEIQERKRKAQKAQKINEIKEARLRIQKVLLNKEKEERIKNEEAKVRAELQREMEQKNIENQKEIEEAQKINAINDERLRNQKVVLQEKDKEERIKNEEANVKTEEESLAKNQEERIKADKENRKRVEKEYRTRVKEAELRAKKAEKENQVLVQKLKKAELENQKMKNQNNDADADNDENHKEKHVKIKIKVHHKNEEEEHEHKKYKIGIKINDHNNNVHHHLVCKNVKVTKNGKVVPSKIEERNVENNGEKQSIHVNFGGF